jgi:integrase
MNKLAKQQGYNYAVNCETPQISAVKGKLRYLSYEEESRLLTHLHPETRISGLSYDTADLRYDQRQDNYDLVVLLLDTGARVNEIAKLTWDSIDLRTGKLQLWRPKVRNESVLCLPDRSLSMLRRRYENRTNEFVFTNGDGTKAKQTLKGIRNAFDRVGLSDCTPHTLRHTFASRMIQNGMNIYEVMLMLGHSKIETTQIYAHLDQKKTTRKARTILNGVSKKIQRQSLRVVGGQEISQ